MPDALQTADTGSSPPAPMKHLVNESSDMGFSLEVFPWEVCKIVDVSRRRGLGLADHPALLGGTLADQIADHGEPGGDAEPHAQILPRRQSADHLDHRQPGAHRALGIVLMRPRGRSPRAGALCAELVACKLPAA